MCQLHAISIYSATILVCREDSVVYLGLMGVDLTEIYKGPAEAPALELSPYNVNQSSPAYTAVYPKIEENADRVMVNEPRYCTAWSFAAGNVIILAKMIHGTWLLRHLVDSGPVVTHRSQRQGGHKVRGTYVIAYRDFCWSTAAVWLILVELGMGPSLGDNTPVRSVTTVVCAGYAAVRLCNAITKLKVRGAPPLFMADWWLNCFSSWRSISSHPG